MSNEKKKKEEEELPKYLLRRQLAPPPPPQPIELSNFIAILQITNLKARGMNFLTIPDTYYENLRERLKHAKIKVSEDMDTVNSSIRITSEMLCF